MPGPLFHFRARRQVAAALQEKGHGFFEAVQLAGQLTNADINDTVASVPEAAQAIGDGTILKAILAFFQSPLGQQLVQALVALLVGLLEPSPAA